MKPVFLVDENISPKTVEFLLALEYKALRVNDVGLRNADDEKIFAYAKDRGMTIVTLDKDFGEMYFFSKNTTGVIVIRTNNPTIHNVNSLLKTLLIREAGRNLEKCLVILTEKAYRIIRRPEKGIKQ